MKLINKSVLLLNLFLITPLFADLQEELGKLTNALNDLQEQLSPKKVPKVKITTHKVEGPIPEKIALFVATDITSIDARKTQSDIKEVVKKVMTEKIGWFEIEPKWFQPQKMLHMTYLFIPSIDKGEIETKLIPALKEAANEFLKTYGTNALKDISFTEGTFPIGRKPNIGIFLEAPEALKKLAEFLRTKLTNKTISISTLPFTPHVSFGRVYGSTASARKRYKTYNEDRKQRTELRSALLDKLTNVEPPKIETPTNTLSFNNFILYYAKRFGDYPKVATFELS